MFQELCKACDFNYFLSLSEAPSLREHFSSYEITIQHCRKRKTFFGKHTKEVIQPRKDFVLESVPGYTGAQTDFITQTSVIIWLFHVPKALVREVLVDS